MFYVTRQTELITQLATLVTCQPTDGWILNPPTHNYQSLVKNK